MATHVSPPQNKTYYINPAYLTFVENSGYGANLIQVSASSSCYISVYDPANGIGYSDADRNYKRWKVTAYNNKFPGNDKFHIYVRLERNGTSALVVYSKSLYNIDGSLEDGSTEASDTYYYIHIGEASATNGTSIREITYDTGYLESDQGLKDSNDLNEMWELDKHSTPWLVRAKQWLQSFTVKGFITLLGGLVLRNGDTEKAITDIKRSIDSDEEVPVNDETVPTTKYVESQLEELDDRFLSKVKPDETPHHIKLLGGLTTSEAESDDYVGNTRKAGWAIKKNDKEDWYAEADEMIARVLAKVYDLLVEHDSTFKGSLSSEEFVSGFIPGKGWSIRMKEWTNAAGVTEKKSVAEFDDLIVRGAMRVYEFIVSQMLGENDNRIYTGMMEVDHYDSLTERVYLKTDGGKLYNPFRKDDVIIVQQYGGSPSEENGYYITKQYEFIVTAAGVGEPGEDRLDWVEIRDFTTSMEGGDRSLIAERDTLVRLDNISDPARKGIIQMMSVGEDTPYMDFVYGAKTDPDNSLKARFGNIGGVYNPLFGWLKDFGAYITNLYAVGEFRIAHTGEDVADAIEIAKGLFRTNHRQTNYDLTEEDDYFTNASFTNDCEHWILGEDTTEYFLVDDLPESFNYELYSSEDTFSGIAVLKGRDMLRLNKSTLLQENEKIDKPSTHKVYTGTTENTDGSYTDVYEEVPDTLYLSVRLYVETSGTLDLGFADASGVYYDNALRYSETLSAQEDAYEVNLSGVWDGKGDFLVKSSGDIYIDRLSLTDRPLDNFRITTETAIEQNAERISLVGKKVNGVEGSVTNLGIVVDAMNGEITSTVEKVDEINNTISTSGWINSDDFVNLFAKHVDENGVVTEADLKVYVKFDPETGEVLSAVKISADQINVSANEYIEIINGGSTKIDSKLIDISVDSLNIKADDLIEIINKGTTTVDSQRININGVFSANNSFVVEEDGTAHIGGYKVSGSDITNEGLDNDASIIFRNDGYKCTAGIGGNVLPIESGGRCVALFENKDDTDFMGVVDNYGMMVTAQGSKAGNIAIGIGGGCISGFAYKTLKVGYEYVTSATRPGPYSVDIDRSVGCVFATTYYYWRSSSTGSYTLYNRSVSLVLPEVYPYDDGHSIKFSTVVVGSMELIKSPSYYYDSSGTLKQGECLILEDGVEITGNSIDVASETVELVFFKDYVRTKDNVTYYGAWIKF